ncbi:MAG: MBL fold metallo-hydrolase [Peptococcaceae bacterium]|nr:MBL fold metallo-hydrolase [Peptococcaceae bacterium]
MLDKLPIKMISLPTPFPVGNINAYLIVEDPVTIIDPGLCYQPSEVALQTALEENGILMSDIKRVVITHGHPDHFGLAGKIQRAGGAEVLARDEEVSKISPDREFIDKMVRSLKTTGIAEDILNLNWNAAFGAFVPYTCPIDSIRPYSGEFSLEFSGFKLQLLHMPGHSGGHTCLYWEEEGVLLSGDMLLPDITSVPALEFDSGVPNLRRRSLSEIISSLARISSMNVELCLPGHGSPVTGPGDLAKSRIEFHKNRLEEIARLVPQGAENGITPYRLSRIYYPRVEGFNKYLAVIEVVSHLDFLSDEGRITERMGEDGVSYFYRDLQ